MTRKFFSYDRTSEFRKIGVSHFLISPLVPECNSSKKFYTGQVVTCVFHVNEHLTWHVFFIMSEISRSAKTTLRVKTD